MSGAGSSAVGHHTVRHIHVRPGPMSNVGRHTSNVNVPMPMPMPMPTLDVSAIPYIPYSENAKTDIQIIQLIKNLSDLSPVQRDALIIRYKTTERVLTGRARLYGRAFHWTRGTVTIGSLFVPALLSIQYNSIVNSDAVYWITWFISLLVGVCNGVISQYKLDKKYYFLHSILEILHSEAWQYLALSGRYSNGMHGYALASHQNQYVYFFHSLERIMMKQVEEEYYKLSDLHQQQHSTRKKPEDSTIGNADVVGIMERDGEKLDMTGMYIPTPANGSALAPAQSPNPNMRRQSVTFAPILEKKGDTYIDGADITTSTTTP